MTNPAMTRLRDQATFIRSKNAGPFMLTVDIFFRDDDTCRKMLEADALKAESIAALYGIEAKTIKIIHVPSARAIKLSFPRPLSAGEVGDNDVAGGQQFAPLLNLSVPR